MAKTLEARRQIQKQFEARTVDKEYLAITEGVPPESGVIDIPLKNHKNRRSRMLVAEDGLPCRTHYEVVATWREYAFLHVRLETGRQHQIRAHMKAIDCPILCDPVYGRRAMLLGSDLGVEPAKEPVLGRHALHCKRMRIEHPTTGEALDLRAPPPPDLAKFIELAGVDLGDA